MKVIIAGAGEVGHHVAKMLTNEEHEITLIDSDKKRLEDLENHSDILTKVGSPTSLHDLQSCGVSSVDLFIAVTPHESINITACMLASNLGAKKTLARINNYEYLQPKNREFFRRLGIHSLIYPEVLAATEIVQTLRRSWIREYRSFADEALVVVCVKVRNNSEIINKEFKTGYFNHDRYLIVAIKRNDQTIIPSGDDMILANDLVYFIAPKENLEIVRNAAGKTLFDIKNIMIMGGSRIAVKTAQYLPDNINVKIIEADKDRCYELAEKLDTLIIHGDGRDINLLQDEGIQDTDAFIAVTENSEANLLACLAAKRLGIKKTVAEVENLDYIDLIDNLDIGTLINKKLVAASHIYQLTFDEDAQNVQCMTYSDAGVVEFVVKSGDRITKAKVRDLSLPKNVKIGGIIRDGKGYVVNGNTLIQPDDHVVIFCKASGLSKLSKFFTKGIL